METDAGLHLPESGTCDKNLISSNLEIQALSENIETSSSSSALSCSNFTMSCSGADTQEENEPSTSGCSSLLAHTEKKRSKAQKKERVKEYLRELKSMVKPDGRGGTLTTLQHVLTSMRKIKGLEKGKLEKKEELADTCQASTLYDLAQTANVSVSHDGLPSDALKHADELQIIVSATDNIVRATSNNIRSVLGCQKDRWIGRLFEDFVLKADIVTFKSMTRLDSDANRDFSDFDVTGKAKIVYLRLRELKSLGSTGFSLRRQNTYKPFQCTFIRKRMCKREMQLEASLDHLLEDRSHSSGISGSMEQPSSVRGLWASSPEEQASSPSSEEETKLYTVFYCVPLISPYTVPEALPETKTFEMRQTLFCSFCNVEPTMIPLLGYLPQEVVGMSIFNFFHKDDLHRLFAIYQKVIALKGVPYKSGQIRLLAKNGCWISCITEWSSFVNPWSKRLEFIIGKHSVVKGPSNVDIFNENNDQRSIEETPQSVLLARQKIKNLLLQPVETVYLGDVNKEKDKHSRQSVAINEDKEMLSSDAEVNMVTKQDTLFQTEREKSGLHGKGILFKDNAISRAYEQLNYTSCIKKFLLSQPHSFSSESDVRKSSSEDGFDDESKNGKSLEHWFRSSIDDLVVAKRVQMMAKSEDTRSLPALNDSFWNKRIISSDNEFDFDISVPKPPSFGSSTKVLVSEQEQRDLENLLDPVNIREQLQPPMPGEMLSPRDVLAKTGIPPPMNLTRESLWKHTILQEQLYLASASPERNILFMNEGREIESPVSSNRQRHTLKRIHSPDFSLDRCKAGRQSEDMPSIPTTASILNPVFPLAFEKLKGSSSSMNSLPKMSPKVVPLQMYPIMIPSSSTVNPDLPNIVNRNPNNMTGVTIRPGEMMGFQAAGGGGGTHLSSNIGLPIPIHQLNSYLMQQGNISPRLIAQPRPNRKQDKGKGPAPKSSSESSYTEDNGSTFYVLETSSGSIPLAEPLQTYNQLVMQSLAQQLSVQRGLEPAPWLGPVNYTDNVQFRYQLFRTKPRRLMKKFREDLDNLNQSEIVLDQLEELLQDLNQGPLMDEENDSLIFEPLEKLNSCSCMKESCCRGQQHEDHGIKEAMKSFRRHGKKKDKRSSGGNKNTVLKMLQDTAVQTDTNIKMEVDSVQELDNGNDQEESEPLVALDIPKSSNADSCCSSNKSQEGESDIPCDMSFDSVNSLTNSNITPSDQRSNNENGSSVKESDGDAMSKKSDSSSSDKQTGSSESDCEVKNKTHDDFFSQLFTTLHMCFPHSHKDHVPWLVDVEFDDSIKMKYHMDTNNQESVLERDRQKLAMLEEPDLVNDQLLALMEDIHGSNVEVSSMIMSSEPGSMETEDRDVALGD